MKPQLNVELYRTEGDTDYIGVSLRIRTDEGQEYVADDAVVTLHIDTGEEITPVINGIPRGDSKGVFLFPTDSIVSLVGVFNIEIQVDDGEAVYTIAAGTLTCFPQIA